MGWAIGDALISAATADDADVVLDLAVERTYGRSRQMIVFSLWRFKRNVRTLGVLLGLIEDPDVCSHAMSALRRTEGNEAALPHLIDVRDNHPNPAVRKQAAKAAKQAERALVR